MRALMLSKMKNPPLEHRRISRAEWEGSFPRDRHRAHAELPVIPRPREESKASAHHPAPSPPHPPPPPCHPKAPRGISSDPLTINLPSPLPRSSVIPAPEPVADAPSRNPSPPNFPPPTPNTTPFPHSLNPPFPTPQHTPIITSHYIGYVTPIGL